VRERGRDTPPTFEPRFDVCYLELVNGLRLSSAFLQLRPLSTKLQTNSQVNVKRLKADPEDCARRGYSRSTT